MKAVKKEENKELRTLKGELVSDQSMRAFKTGFGNLSGTVWERLDYFDEATFTKDGHIMSAFYDDGGKLFGTTTRSTIAALPKSAQQYINDKGYSATVVIYYDDNELNEKDMILYGYQFDDQDSYFVEMVNGAKKVVLQVGADGEVSYFTRLR